MKLQQMEGLNLYEADYCCVCGGQVFKRSELRYKWMEDPKLRYFMRVTVFAYQITIGRTLKTFHIATDPLI